MSDVATNSLRAHLLADARQVAGPGMRRARLLGPAIAVVIVVLSLWERPAPALSGAGLVVVLALAGLVASVAVLLRRPGERTRLAALGAMGAVSSTLVWIQHGGPGVAGLFLAVGYAAMALPVRKSLPVFALAAVELPVLALHAHRTPTRTAMIELAIVTFYALGALARRAQEDHEQTKALLSEMARALEDAQKAAHRQLAPVSQA
jgi:hypothetical protein